ncbi:putative disease resistance protein RGA4 [Chenopodium quinoa]|uniref:putative disease resistance protein RGA4 n=1 Tax=Chenopodium quinoa TaxID=63459 RepID=UPI000B773589|nr:putative disease resistance protein RGA4 [Chenopodium quinoa]
MGGIGKTTLAQFVYNDEKVKAHFVLKAWVCISDVFDVKRITKDIINSATLGNFDCNNLNEAQQKLQEVQHVHFVYSDLAERRDDIIRKCDGLPLAAKTLGGQLRKIVDKGKRQRILDSHIWSDK